MRAALWVLVQDKPMVYEQEVANAIVMRYGFIGKNDPFESTNTN